MPESIERAVAAHYSRDGLLGAILEGLTHVGADLDNLQPADLAPVDEFHTAGRRTTARAIELTPIVRGMHVLDIGCGIGGTARSLALEHGCRVTGLDLTPEFIAVARHLTHLMRLAESCTFHVGSATEMPFADGTFDAAVSFHAAMNIEDRTTLYAESARVLRPGAPFCLFDVMRGAAPGLPYPLPWAETPATSFLKTRTETRGLLTEAGFVISAEEDLTDFARAHFRRVLAKVATTSKPPAFGLHLLTGPNAAEKSANYAAALEAGQLEPVILVATRP